MNVDPGARTVLCFGDSNTYGQRAEDVRGRRPIDVRWTGRLQLLLGAGYSVIEEGLNGRTTDLDEQRPGRNGRTYQIPCLESHHPVGILVLGLSGNNLKPQFRRSVPEMGASLDRADAGRAMSSFADVPGAAASLLELVLDGGNTFVTRVTAEALLRRQDEAGLAVIAEALVTADAQHSTYIHDAVVAVLGIFAGERDDAVPVCEALAADPNEQVRRGYSRSFEMLNEINPVFYPEQGR